MHLEAKFLLSVFLYKLCIYWLANPCLKVVLFYLLGAAINDVVISDICLNVECRITHFSCELIWLQCSKQRSYGSVVNKEVCNTWRKLSVSSPVYFDDSCLAFLGYENYMIWNVVFANRPSVLLPGSFEPAINAMWLIIMMDSLWLTDTSEWSKMLFVARWCSCSIYQQVLTGPC